MRDPCRVREGVTLFLGQTRSGKTTLMLRELEEDPQRRAIVFDMRASQTLARVPGWRTRDQVRRFLRSPAARGAWLRAARFTRSEDYAWLAGSVVGWRGVVWVIDDAAGQLEIPEVLSAAIECARAGRHFGDRRGVELWLAAHRPVDIPPGIRAQVLRLRSFRQKEPRDLQQLERWTSGAFAARIAQLTGHDHVSWPEDEGDQVNAG